MRPRTPRSPLRLPATCSPQSPIAKAQADEVLAIVVTPLAASAPYWPKLLRAALVTNKSGYIRLRSQQHCPPVPTPRVSSPFSPSTSRPTPPATVPPHPLPPAATTEHRGRLTAGSPHDQSERRRIHEELAAAQLALRPAPHSPSYPPSPKTRSLNLRQPGLGPRSQVQCNRLGSGRRYLRSPSSLYV